MGGGGCPTLSAVGRLQQLPRQHMFLSFYTGESGGNPLHVQGESGGNPGGIQGESILDAWFSPRASLMSRGESAQRALPNLKF